jgi:uncharacterized protein with GYD domain
MEVSLRRHEQPVEEDVMPTYISLVKMTDQGAKTVKELPQRVELGRENMKKLGIELKSWFMTTGQYDVVVTVEAPNDEAVAAFALSLVSQGNAKTETMRAFSMEELKGLIQKMP